MPEVRHADGDGRGDVPVGLMEMEELKTLPSMDRSKWKRVRFGDVVRCVDKTCRNPEAEGLTRVVGLEHLDPGELKITRWADVTDGTSFTRTFRAGQVLFGKRRAYQRKAAVADFDGICSGDILVFESSSDDLHPSLLPFIVQSDSFFDHALRTSAGSLSPRTKWTELSSFSFLLPTVREQSRWIEILSAAEECCRLNSASRESLQDFVRARLSKGVAEAEMRNLGSLCSISSGATPRRSEARYWKGEFPWLTTSRVNDGIIRNADEFVTEAALDECSLPICEPGSTLVALYGEGKTRGMVAMLDITATINQAFACLVPSDSVRPWYLYLALRFRYEELRAFSQGTNQKNLSGRLIADFKIPLPNLEIQDQIVLDVRQALDAAEAIESHMVRLRDLRSQISAFLLGAN